MASTSSLTSEVLEAINLPNLKPIISYLSEDDAVTVDMFMQSEYARDYMIDTRNIHWGGEVHQSHVFDIYAKFSPSKDAVKVRLDMIQFVAANQKRYNWNAHLYLTMNELTLDTWIQKMMFWENCADALAIYSLSDMLGIHTTILTKSKPWTTVSGEYQGDVCDLLEISGVCLVYLGQGRHAQLWKKTTPEGNSYIGPSFNYNPMSSPTAPPTEEDIDIAHTLLELQGIDPIQEDINTIALPVSMDAMDKVVEHGDTCLTSPLNVQDAMDTILEPSVLQVETVTQHHEKSTVHEDTNNMAPPVLMDAMDKVVEHVEIYLTGPLNVPDAMDSILDTHVLQVETVMPTPRKHSVLRVETKPCTVNLIRLESILDEDLPKIPPTTDSNPPVGKYFTRSRSNQAPRRTGRKPRIANTGISYNESEKESEEPVQRRAKVTARKPNRSGPSQDRIISHSSSSVAPSVRLPPAKQDAAEPPTASENTSEEESSTDTDDDIPLAEVAKKLRGTFTTRQHALVKQSNVRKYKCRMCDEQLPSCKALTAHHQAKHGVIYCSKCKKAFNNPRSLLKHMYYHKEKTHVCKRCGKRFPFASQLETHKLVHREKPNQVCMYPNCGRRFKNKSDLNRHAATHTKPWLKCPDCPNYKTKEKRNFESHHLTHNKIKRYNCEKCGEEFTFNTQKLRHIAKKRC